MRRIPSTTAIAYVSISANVMPLLSAITNSNTVIKERKSIVFRFNVSKLYHPES